MSTDGPIKYGLRPTLRLADIELQFEFIQAEWIGKGDFIGLPTDEKDPLVGANGEGGQFTVPDADMPFLFCAQSYVGEATTPIEDATSVWPTPFEPIATLSLPAQDFTAPEQFAVCERLSYTPRHCMPAHRPLGGIQRCRRRLYEESQRLRQGLAGAGDREPTKTDYDALGRFL